MGLSVAFDLPTHRGYDSDHPRVAGDVGMAGVAIDSIIDMKGLFDGIPLERMSVSMTMNGAVLPVMALLYRGRRGTRGATGQAVGDHPERHSEGVHGPQHLHLSAWPLDADRLRRFRLHLARDAEVQLDLGVGLSHAGGGASADLELGYTLADGLEYVRAGIKAGLAIDDFAPRISFFWAIGMNFYMEIAKLRAARLLWAKLMQQFAPKNPRSSSLRTHCQTSGWSLTAQDPFNNVTRTLVEALAATHGQTQSAPHQCAGRGAGAAERLLGKNRPQHAACSPEGGGDLAGRSIPGRQLLSRAVDPGAGGTGASAHHRGRGARGTSKAIAAGIPKLRIEEAAARTQARIDSGAQLVVGVKACRVGTDEELKILKVDNSAVRRVRSPARAAQGRARQRCGAGGPRQAGRP